MEYTKEQKLWANMAESCPVGKTVFISVGRQTGKTHFAISQALSEGAMGKRVALYVPSRLRIFVLGRTLDALEDSILKYKVDQYGAIRFIHGGEVRIEPHAKLEPSMVMRIDADIVVVDDYDMLTRPTRDWLQTQVARVEKSLMIGT